ncbi:MAG: hypothetical protein AXW17_07100 [Colwellia sp. Phe_37]|nr:MAG: hypothetical protein AXW17_07100 [Colwellia sp. Phe_37]
MKEKLPNFLVVGATKSGTTSIYNYLQQHENIFLNPKVKETNFFIEPKSVLGCGPRFCGKDSYAKNIVDYQKLFYKVDENCHKSVGEVCTTYLHFSAHAIPNIKKYLGDPKIIIILRNPVDRAYSYYMHNVRDGDETLSFEGALDCEAERKKRNLWLSFRLKELGLYSAHVQAYLENFSNVKVVIYEEMREDIAESVNDMVSFLGEKRCPVDISQNYNMSGVPKNRILHNLVHGNNLVFKILLRLVSLFVGIDRVRRFQNSIDKKNLVKVNMKLDTRKELTKYYQEDIGYLSSLINKDLEKIWKI